MPILGVDEVGRGPWAGPLVLGAVILDPPADPEQEELSLDYEFFGRNPEWLALDDSKKLSKNRRSELDYYIRRDAFSYGLGWVHAKELDELGLAEALHVATRRAVAECLKNAGVEDPERLVSDEEMELPKGLPMDEIIIDGNENFLSGTPLSRITTTLTKGDQLVKEISAASIIAKVAHDEYMVDVVAKKYPGYDFEHHVGYGTPKHRQALLKLGPTPEHRDCVKPVAARKRKLKQPLRSEPSTVVGQHAEQIVAEYLQSKGHKIIARNFKTKYYEIDIVSATKDAVYFTEVKYRKDSYHGTPFAQIGRKKRDQLDFAARCFMQYLSHKMNRPLDSMPSPRIAAAAVSGPDFRLEKWEPLG